MYDWERELAERKMSFGAPEKSHLYSSSDEMGFQPKTVDFGGQKASQAIQKQGQSGEAAIMKAMTEGAASGAATGNPYVAAATVGGSLLAQAMSNEAQAKQAQRQRAMQIAQEQGQGEQRAFQMLMDAYRGALR